MDTSDPTPAVSGQETQLSVEDVLNMHIPKDVIGSCDVLDHHEVEGRAYASVVCHPGEPVIEVQYSTFHDAVALRDQYQHDLLQAGISSDNTGDCSHTAYGAGQWWSASPERVDQVGEVDHKLGRPLIDDATRGRYMCYESDGDAWIEWFDNDTHIYGWASASQDAYHELYDWWSTQAGPFHPPM
jgi:hypothetical protein